MEKNYNLVNPEIVEYVKENVFPRYDSANGHGLDHIQNVIRRSLNFAKRINDGEIKTTAEDFKNLPEELAQGKVNYDICFVVAAYHDLGREKNNKLHHLVSAAWFLDDDFMEEIFTRDELRVAADAIMDHRASNKLEPMTIYGKIVSSADRDTDCYDIMRRAYAYNRHCYPDWPVDKARELCNKYGVSYNEDVAETELDTYRDWLDAKSRCPKCGLTRYQTSDGEFHCPRCENFT